MKPRRVEQFSAISLGLTLYNSAAQDCIMRTEDAKASARVIGPHALTGALVLIEQRTSWERPWNDNSGSPERRQKGRRYAESFDRDHGQNLDAAERLDQRHYGRH
jgi:hypothetical protein